MNSFHELQYPIYERNESLPTRETYYIPIGLHIEDNNESIEHDDLHYKENICTLDNHIYNTFIYLAVIDDDIKTHFKSKNKTKKITSKNIKKKY